MSIHYSKIALMVSKIYAVIALITFISGLVALTTIKAPLSLIDLEASKNTQLLQAEKILHTALHQIPESWMLRYFYQADWLIEYDYDVLMTYDKPLYEGDSFLKRVQAFNQTSQLSQKTYNDCIYSLLILSAGGVFLSILFLNSSSFFISLLILSYPVVTLLALTTSNFFMEPVTVSFVPVFFGLGVVIYLFQTVYFFRFGYDGAKDYGNTDKNQNLYPFKDLNIKLIQVRRSLVCINLGFFMILACVSGAINSSGSSGYVSMPIAIFGEEIIGWFTLITGVFLLLLGFYLKIKTHSD